MINNYLSKSMGILIFLILIYSCEKKANIPVKKDNVTNEELNKEKTKQVNINYTLGGKSKASLSASEMIRVQIDTNPYISFKPDILINFYEIGDTIPNSFITAEYAEYFELKNIFHLKHKVKFINPQKGDTLLTEELWWDRNKIPFEFYTTKAVQINTPLQKVNGINGMESKKNFKEWNIKGVKNSTLQIEDKGDF